MTESNNSANDELISSFFEVMQAEAKWLNVWRVARLASCMLGDRLEVGEASQYIYHYARRQGYDLPPIPFAGNGEFKQFLADEKVGNIPEWYARFGVSHETYQRIYEKTLIAVRRMDGKRKIILLDGILYKQDFGFKTLDESGFVTKARPEQVEAVLREVFDFLRTSY